MTVVMYHSRIHDIWETTVLNSEFLPIFILGRVAHVLYFLRKDFTYYRRYGASGCLDSRFAGKFGHGIL